jgi:hypothetical protein
VAEIRALECKPLYYALQDRWTFPRGFYHKLVDILADNKVETTFIEKNDPFPKKVAKFNGIKKFNGIRT